MRKRLGLWTAGIAIGLVGVALVADHVAYRVYVDGVYAVVKDLESAGCETRPQAVRLRARPDYVEFARAGEVRLLFAPPTWAWTHRLSPDAYASSVFVVAVSCGCENGVRRVDLHHGS